MQSAFPHDGPAAAQPRRGRCGLAAAHVPDTMQSLRCSCEPGRRRCAGRFAHVAHQNAALSHAISGVAGIRPTPAHLLQYLALMGAQADERVPLLAAPKVATTSVDAPHLRRAPATESDVSITVTDLENLPDDSFDRITVTVGCQSLRACPSSLPRAALFDGATQHGKTHTHEFRVNDGDIDRPCTFDFGVNAARLSPQGMLCFGIAGSRRGSDQLVREHS